MNADFKWLPQPKFNVDVVRGIALGAPYQLLCDSHGHDFGTCDDLDYHEDPEEIRAGFKDSWSIKNREDVFDTIGRLLEGMHAPGFDGLLDYLRPLRDLSPAETKSALATIRRDKGRKAAKYLERALPVVRLPRMPMELPDTAYGWDICRASMLARRMSKAGYVTEEEMLPLLDKAAYAAQLNFRSWQELGLSFYVGRALWMCLENEKIEDISYTFNEDLEFFQRLLYDPLSPWVQIPWESVE